MTRQLDPSGSVLERRIELWARTEGQRRVSAPTKRYRYAWETSPEAWDRAVENAPWTLYLMLNAVTPPARTDKLPELDRIDRLQEALREIGEYLSFHGGPLRRPHAVGRPPSNRDLILLARQLMPSQNGSARKTARHVAHIVANVRSQLEADQAAKGASQEALARFRAHLWGGWNTDPGDERGRENKLAERIRPGLRVGNTRKRR